jgi:hypothetical protein
VLLAVLLLGRPSGWAGAALMVAVLAVLLPVIGAFLGLRLAQQNRPREEIAGTLMLGFGAVTAVVGPQFLAATRMIGLGFSLSLLILGCAALCWWLQAGALRGLDRIFLPLKES